MDRLMERFNSGVVKSLGENAWDQLSEMVPTEMQGLSGLLRGAFQEAPGAPLITVRLWVDPWDTDERWTAMVRGRELGDPQFWEWLADEPMCRVPFVRPEFKSQCLRCGDDACIHGAALTYHWILRVKALPKFLLLLLNRRGRHYHTNLNVQPIVRVPVVLGTNLDRTRRELVAILESSLKVAIDQRDDLFGGGASAHTRERD